MACAAESVTAASDAVAPVADVPVGADDGAAARAILSDFDGPAFAARGLPDVVASGAVPAGADFASLDALPLEPPGNGGVRLRAFGSANAVCAGTFPSTAGFALAA